MQPPNYYPATCSGPEPLTKSGWWTNVFLITCSPNTQNKHWLQSMAALNVVQTLGTSIAPTATRPIGTSGSAPTRNGECLTADKDGRSCQCHGSRLVSGQAIPNYEFGSFGGSYCEVQSCPIPQHDTRTTKDPVLIRVVSLLNAFNVTLTPEIMAQPNFFPSYVITYNGTASPNYCQHIHPHSHTFAQCVSGVGSLLSLKFCFFLFLFLFQILPFVIPFPTARCLRGTATTRCRRA